MKLELNLNNNKPVLNINYISTFTYVREYARPLQGGLYIRDLLN